MPSIDGKTWRICFPMAVFLVGVIMILLPLTLFAGEPAPAQGGRGYVPTVPAAEDGSTVQLKAPEVPNPNDPNTSPLSRPDRPAAGEMISEKEKVKVIQLWNELCDAVGYDRTNDFSVPGTKTSQDPSSQISFVESSSSVLDRSNGVKLAEQASRILEALTSSNDQKDRDVLIRQTQAAIKGSQNGGNDSLINNLTRVGLRTGEAGMSVGASGYPAYSMESSKPLSQYVATTLQNVGTYIKEKLSLAKENVADETVRGTLLTIETATTLKKLPDVSVDAKDQDGALVLRSVEINKQTAAMHALMNPPKNLHPYMRWLLYERHVTPERIKQYVRARQKVEQIFNMAKAGEGQIRYNGKVCDVYLPLPDELGGRYELIAPAVNPK